VRCDPVKVGKALKVGRGRRPPQPRPTPRTSPARE
jgi:hypothetical protein